MTVPIERLKQVKAWYQDRTLTDAINARLLDAGVTTATQSIVRHQPKIATLEQLTVVARGVLTAGECLPHLKELDRIQTELEAILSESPANVARLERWIGGLSGLGPAVDALAGLIRDRWTAMVDAALVPHQQLTSFLERFSATRAMALPMRVTCLAAQKLKSQLPPTDAHRAELQKVVDQMQVQRSGITGLTPAVSAFLADLQRGSTTLDRLTPDVLDWLRSHGALGAFTVSLR